MKNNYASEFLSVREKIGQLIMLDFRFWGKDDKGNFKPFTEPSAEVSRIISSCNIGGIALFRENCRTTEQIVRLIDSLQKSARFPLLIGIDQEGGIVTRLQEGTDTPGNMALGAVASPKVVRKTARLIGEELAALGINLNFAPVLDVNSNQRNPIIGVRSFGSNERDVARLGKAYIQGLAESDTLSCGKHFPGHGNTESDTHLGLAVINNFNRKELLPFKKAAACGLDAIMAAHVIAPDLDDGKEISKKDGSQIGCPTTFSKKILTNLLRKKLGFQGIVLTDALDMKAISDFFGKEEACVKTILAGADMAVMPVTVRSMDDFFQLNKLIGNLVSEYETNESFAERVDESLQRILMLKEKLKPKGGASLRKRIKVAEAVVRCRKHKNFEEKISSRALTLIKNEDNTLPLKLNEDSKILIVGYSKSAVEIFSSEIKEGISLTTEVVNQESSISDELKVQIESADYIALLTYNLNDKTKLPLEITRCANDKGKKLVMISCRNPYDIAYCPEVKANIAIYGAPGFDQTNSLVARFATNLKSSVKAIFILPGEEKPSVCPRGKLPVDIFSSDGKELMFKMGSGLNPDDAS